MSHGEKYMFDTPENVFSKGRELEKLGLQVPQVTKIMLLLKESGIDVDQNILTVEQAFTEIVNHLGNREG